MSRYHRQKSPTCNDKVLAYTVAHSGETPKMVKEIINFYTAFIAMQIKSGGFASVRIHKFGVFKPKLDKVAGVGKGRRPVYTKRVRGGETYGSGRRAEPNETL